MDIVNAFGDDRHIKGKGAFDRYDNLTAAMSRLADISCINQAEVASLRLMSSIHCLHMGTPFGPLPCRTSTTTPSMLE